MAKVKLGANGPTCPRCGGTTFSRRNALQWKPGQMECVGCGKVVKPAGRVAAARAKRKG